MTLYEFNCLNENEKAEYIWQHCNFIGNIINDNTILMLYGSNGKQNFFAEIEMQENKIIGIRSFIKGEQLEKYVNRIDILKLINDTL